MEILHVKGYLSTRGISTILIINAPKWRRSAANCVYVEISKLSNVFELKCAFRLNSANYKRNNLIKKKIFRCLPNIQETLIEVQSFHSICLKIRVKFKRYTL